MVLPGKFVFVNSLTGFYIPGTIVFKIRKDDLQFLLLISSEFKGIN